MRAIGAEKRVKRAEIEAEKQQKRLINTDINIYECSLLVSVYQEKIK